MPLGLYELVEGLLEEAILAEDRRVPRDVVDAAVEALMGAKTSKVRSHASQRHS